jgi:solute carrier family 13 (sodium-dependent dicarboxylate transporter), member 2/3/5
LSDSHNQKNSAIEAAVPSRGFEFWRKRLGMILTPVVFLLIYSLTSGLGYEGRTLAAILGAVSLMWISEIIPLPVSALLGAVLCVLLGVADAKTVLAYFADPIVFVFIGGFMIARAMMIHELDRRIALGFLSIPWIGSSQIRIMAGLGLVTAVISMWVSNSAVTAMMFPIALGILGALQTARLKAGVAEGSINVQEWPYATAMMLMVAYAASIGGIGTPVGTPPNLIGIGLIKNATGVEISFFRWMSLALPLFVVMALFLFLLLYMLHMPVRETQKKELEHQVEKGHSGSARADSEINEHLREYIKNELKIMGPWTSGQVNTLIGFGTAVVLWVLPGILQLPWFDSPLLVKWMNAHLPESIVAISSAILLFALPVNRSKGEFTLSWKEAVRIDWGTILLFGGGLALGSLMFKTGVAKEMGYGMVELLGVKTLWAITGLSIAMAIVLSEAASNTAAANMIIPVVIAIAQAAGVSPLPPALGACLGASFGFMLPVSTPPNAIVYGSGLIPLTKMITAGILFDIIGFFIIWMGLYLLCPLLGLV